MVKKLVDRKLADDCLPAPLRSTLLSSESAKFSLRKAPFCMPRHSEPSGRAGRR
jgi:hypothetical protein